MSYEEMLTCCKLLVKMGIEKIRITGGEPFVRKDIMQLLTALYELQQMFLFSYYCRGINFNDIVNLKVFVPHFRGDFFSKKRLILDLIYAQRALSRPKVDQLKA